MPLLSIRNLRVRYGQIKGSEDINLSISPGEMLALVGSNGAGKSSTLKAIMRLAVYDQGLIEFDGIDLKERQSAEVVKLGIGFSPEGRRVFGQLTVAENLRVGAYTRSSQDCDARMEEIYGYFPRLRERFRQRASSLSGGEQQMLAIGRGLMSRPRLFLLDEPSLGLAPIIVDRIGELLTDICRKEQLAVILAEQNAVWAMSVCQRAVILELGRTTLEGATADLLRDPRVQNAYMGI